MDKYIDKFIDELKKSLADLTFVKLTLGNYKGTDNHLQKILARPVETKKGMRLLVQSRYETRDTVKNYEFDEGVGVIRDHVRGGFRSGHLFTTAGDLQLTVGKRSARLISGKPTFTSRPTAAHDREKKTWIDPNVFYLKALGITTDKGEVRSEHRDKWRQINKFVEILAGLIETSPLKDRRNLKIVDMGSGKGYLTFAAYDYLSNVRGTQSVEMIGVEVRHELADLCNDIAKAGSFDGLKFVQGRIVDFDLSDINILIALHACDTATDDALYKGIRANASIIIAAPCCHKEVRRQIKAPEFLEGVLKHGILMERTAESITDGLRSLLLERESYKTKMVEFVPTEHTPKNNLLIAVRHKDGAKNRYDVQINAIMREFGISDQRLHSLLAKKPAS